MTDWQPMATWPPKKIIGRHFVFWQPESQNGRAQLAPRVVAESPGSGARETSHWAEIIPPGEA